MRFYLVIALAACLTAFALVSNGMGQEATQRCTAEHYDSGNPDPTCPDPCYNEYGGIWDVSGCPGFCDNNPGAATCPTPACPEPPTCPEPPPCVSEDEVGPPVAASTVAPPVMLPRTGGAPN